MELERYRALLCAVETGSLSAAAEQLQYTPSGISRMIAAIEEENGFPLLIREHNGVRLTQEGEQILPAIREMLRSGDYCAQLAAQLRGLETGTVVIGTAYSAFYPVLARVTSDFHEKYPGIQIQFRSGYSTELLEQLNLHKLDCCIISKREGTHTWLPVCQDELVAWVADTHPLASMQALPIRTFAEEPYIETYPDEDIDNARVFAKCGIKPNLQFSTMDSLATYYMVEAGLGISMNNAINGRAWSGRVHTLSIDPPQFVELGMAVHTEMSPVARTFVQFIMPYLEKL